jgi:hypothetical protein
MNSEDITLSEISESQKEQIFRKSSNSETDSRTVVAKGWGEEKMGGYYLMGVEFYLGRIKSAGEGQR